MPFLSVPTMRKWSFHSYWAKLQTTGRGQHFTVAQSLNWGCSEWLPAVVPGTACTGQPDRLAGRARSCGGQGWLFLYSKEAAPPVPAFSPGHLNLLEERGCRLPLHLPLAPSSEDGSRDHSILTSAAPPVLSAQQDTNVHQQTWGKVLCKNILISFEEDKFINCTTVFISLFRGNVI